MEASALIGYAKCPMALTEADDLLLAMDDALLAAVDRELGSPSIILKRWPPARCMAGRANSLPPMLASIIMTVSRLEA